jgi:DNA mismatch endonuclease (patch repair protein)
VADTISRRRRSQNMRHILSKGTKPEMVVRRLVHSLGYRFRLHVSDMPGKPDIVLPSHRKIIEVRGCFWHQHFECIDSHIPKSRVSYWKPKLRKNVVRGGQNLKALRKLGWRVLVVWECEVRPSRSERLKKRVAHFLK